MIYYLATRKHAYTMGEYLGSWGSALQPRIRIVAYGALPANDDLPRGTYLFTDMDRLSPLQRAFLASLWDQLAAAGLRLVNHPEKSFGRLQLLAHLHASGRNRFQAFRPTAKSEPWRYPVFLRQENDHTGALSPLLFDRHALEGALVRLIMEGVPERDILVVELCDTADDQAIYRKYSAFRIGEQILPRHVLFSKNWQQKDLDLLEPEHRAEIRSYIADNPHAAELRAIFDEAGIDYGRIDYGFLDGQMQVWEINTNPVVMRPREQYDPSTHAFHGAFSERYADALTALDTVEPGPRIVTRWNAPPWEEIFCTPSDD